MDDIERIAAQETHWRQQGELAIKREMERRLIVHRALKFTTRPMPCGKVGQPYYVRWLAGGGRVKTVKKSTTLHEAWRWVIANVSVRGRVWIESRYEPASAHRTVKPGRLRTAAVAVFALLASTIAFAQTPVLGTERLAWDQPAADLVEAQSYHYLPMVDGMTPTAEFQGVTCTGAASPFACSVRLLSLPTGIHELRIVTRAVWERTPPDPPLVADASPSEALRVLVVAVPMAAMHLRLTGP